MSYDTAPRFEEPFAVGGPVGEYWVAALRVLTGWWFFHAGVTKLIEDGLAFGYAPAYLQGMEGTVLGPVAVWMGSNLGWFLQAFVPVAETTIGLALLLGIAVRLVSFGGAAFMAFFWVGNAEFGHGLVNGDLMGLLLFVTMMALAAGRYYGVDAVLERTEFVRQRPRLRYLLG